MAKAKARGELSSGTHSGWALLTFAVAAGAVDAASYIGLGRVFTANMTGNTVLLAVAAAEHSGARAARSGVALAGFSVGVALGAVTRRESEGRDWLAQVAPAVTLGALTLTGLGVGWGIAGARPALYPLIAASGVAMGLQSAATQAAPVAGVSTTYLTGTLTRLVEGLARKLRSGVRAEGGAAPRLRAGVWLVYIAGAAIGAFAERAWHAGVVAIPAALTAAVAVAGLTRISGRRSRGRDGSPARRSS